MRRLHLAIALSFLFFDLMVVALCPLVGLTLLPCVLGSAFWVRGAWDAL